jgi:hypothetical protein
MERASGQEERTRLSSSVVSSAEQGLTALQDEAEDGERHKGAAPFGSLRQSGRVPVAAVGSDARVPFFRSVRCESGLSYEPPT